MFKNYEIDDSNNNLRTKITKLMDNYMNYPKLSKIDNVILKALKQTKYFLKKHNNI